MVRIYIEKLKAFIVSNQFHYFVICLIVLLAVFLRLVAFSDYTNANSEWRQLYNNDLNRDYLIANHIVTYGETSFNGPDGYLGSVWVSPLYYYLLAAVVEINSNILVLGFFNVLL